MRMFTTCSLAAAAFAVLSPAQGTRPHPLVGESAPAWPSMQWLQSPEGVERPQVTDYAGKVLYLYCFQAFCNGCKEHGLPTLSRLRREFRGREDVAFVAVQTVFEDVEHNTADAARAKVMEFELGDMPVAHDGGPSGDFSALMSAYQTKGTPWTVIIDRAGVVRFADFTIEPDRATALIEKLAAKPVERSPLLGEPLGSTEELRWLRAAHEGDEPQWTLYRWWTDGCPFCRDSLPDLTRVVGPYVGRLRLVAVHHQKGPDPLSDERLLAYLGTLGYEGAVATDPEWITLRRLMERGGFDAPTSVSLLVDPEGVVRWFHPGPRVHRSEVPEFAGADRDMRALEDLLRRELGER